MPISSPRVSSPRRFSLGQRSFGFLDIAVARNATGRQRHSFEAVDDDGALPLVFIRAPAITRVGAAVQVLATFRGQPVLVRQGAITGAAFHPELTQDLGVHRAVFGEAGGSDSRLTLSEKCPVQG